MEQCLGVGLLSLSLSLSLSLASFLFEIYFFNFLNLFARLVILSLAKNPHKSKENLPFLDTSLSLSMTNSGFCLKITDKENALYHLAMTTRHNTKTTPNLWIVAPFLKKWLAMTDKNHNFAHQKHFFAQILGTKFIKFISYTQILKQKFKFFTQNSRHFINSTHFITLSQILSPTQGFFIFLPQVFAQFLLINSLQRSSYERQGTKAPF